MAKFHEELTTDQREWVDNLRRETWTLACEEGGRRYGHMTTNLSEAINKVLKGARNLPITALVKVIHSRLVTYFVDRLGHAQAMLAEDKIIVPKVMAEIEKNKALASTFRVLRYNRPHSKFEIQEPTNPRTGGGGMKWKVSLNDWRCECGRWQAYNYPCAHVIAACTRVARDWKLYVDPVFMVETVAKVYESEWEPIGNELNIPPPRGPTIVPDPRMIRGKGRPKTTRIKNEMDQREPGAANKCGHCRQVGHNRANCTQVAAKMNELFGDDDEMYDP